MKNAFSDSVWKKIVPNKIIPKANNKFIQCWALNTIAFAPNFPDNFPKAMTDAVNVIAPINAPINNSNLWTVECVSPEFNTAAIAINTAASPTKECINATNSGILVICTVFAAYIPIHAPRTNGTNINKVIKFCPAHKVAPTAIVIPIIPNKLPCLADFGDDNPFKANIKNIADNR